MSTITYGVEDPPIQLIPFENFTFNRYVNENGRMVNKKDIIKGNILRDVENIINDKKVENGKVYIGHNINSWYLVYINTISREGFAKWYNPDGTSTSSLNKATVDDNQTLTLTLNEQVAGKPRKNSLESLTVKELKERAKLRKLKGYSTLKKADLIALLRRK